MPVTSLIAGQALPAPGILTTLYTVPALTQAQLTIFAANQGTLATTIRIAITPRGTLISLKDYIVYDLTMAALSVYTISAIALNEGDYVTVRSTAGRVSFNATGLEIT